MGLARILFCISVLFSTPSIGQDSDLGWSFEGYFESYYLFDFGRPENHERPSFLYNHKRHNEFSVNLAMLGMRYAGEKHRGAVKLMAGNYGQYLLAHEPIWAQFVYEASAGVNLGGKVWLDIGIMPSGIGFETPIGADSWHLSRSLLAENSPYYFSGARVTYDVSHKLQATLWVTNGWQNVQRTHRNESIGVVLGLDYTLGSNTRIHYAGVVGNTYPSPLKRVRIFHNTYVQYEGSWFDLIAAVDYGMEQRLFTTSFNEWLGATVSMRRSFSGLIAGALRAEYYADPRGVILSEETKISGFSANVDFSLSENAILRFEGRRFLSTDPIFNRPRGLVNKGNSAVATALCIRF